MDATKELEMMKDGARRMQDFLKEKGLDVKHSVMLEAISAGFGGRNWRTVREKLNSPLGGTTATLEELGGCRWAVHGVYCDNDQRYTGYYAAETALEAQIFAQVERLFADGGAEISVTTVIDQLTGQSADEESFTFDTALVNVTTMLQRLAVAARRNMGEPPARGISEAEAWDSKNLAVEVFEELLGAADATVSSDQAFLQSELNQLWYQDLPEYNDIYRQFTFTDNRGVEYDQLSAIGELQEMLDIIMSGGIEKLTDDEKFCVYQAEAIIKYAGEIFDHIFASSVTEP